MKCELIIFFKVPSKIAIILADVAYLVSLPEVEVFFFLFNYGCAAETLPSGSAYHNV